jgi:hypothetical protein
MRGEKIIATNARHARRLSEFSGGTRKLARRTQHRRAQIPTFAANTKRDGVRVLRSRRYRTTERNLRLLAAFQPSCAVRA